MPLLSIHTNTKIDDIVAEKIVQSASKLVANMLGKPEQYVMVMIQINPFMVFAGNQQPLLYAELKSIELQENKSSEYSTQLTEFFEEEFKISADRIYIEFSNAQAHLWGWNGTTF